MNHSYIFSNHLKRLTRSITGREQADRNSQNWDDSAFCQNFNRLVLPKTSVSTSVVLDAVQVLSCMCYRGIFFYRGTIGQHVVTTISSAVRNAGITTACSAPNPAYQSGNGNSSHTIKRLAYGLPSLIQRSYCYEDSTSLLHASLISIDIVEHPV